MAGRCFACDRKLGKSPKLVDTRDGQLVYIGSECFKKIAADGWQPPKGGPKLYPLNAERLFAAHLHSATGSYRFANRNSLDEFLSALRAVPPLSLQGHVQ